MKAILAIIFLTLVGSITGHYYNYVTYPYGTQHTSQTTRVCSNPMTLWDQKITEGYNKAMTLQYIQEFIGDKNLDAAAKYVDKDKYIQHNPLVADGLEGMKKVAKQMFEGNPPIKVDVQRVAAEGDLVWVHWRDTQLFGPVTSIIDIYRWECGKMVEHWDAVQSMPDKSENDHPLF